MFVTLAPALIAVKVTSASTVAPFASTPTSSKRHIEFTKPAPPVPVPV